VKIHLPANLEELLFRLLPESASKILSQLNNLAGDLISGVELNFDLVPPRITPLDNWKIKLT
jgi:hypothetical protein